MAPVKPGSVVHVEFASADPARTRRFLEEVFGWEFQSIPGMDYYPFSAPSGPGGAIMKPSDERPGGILNYVLTDDIERDLKKIERAGGRVRLGKTEVPDLGWWALFEEPMGSVLALFQSRTPDRGPVARYRTGP